MKAVIMNKIKEAESNKGQKFTKYDALRTDNNQKIYLNVFDSKMNEQIDKDTIVEVEVNGNFYNLKEIVGKQEKGFQNADDYGKTMDINMCFKKACDIEDVANIPQATEALYQKLLEARKRILDDRQ